MVDKLKTQLDKAKIGTQKRMERTKIVALGVTADVVEGAEIASRPLRHVGKFLPFGAAILSEDKDVYYAERAAEFKRRKSIKHAVRDNRLDDVTIPTLR